MASDEVGDGSAEQPPEARQVVTELDTSEVPSYPDLLRLDGKGVVVAGAGQGIGRQVTHALAQAGARVYCIDVNPEAADHVAGEVDGIAAVGDIRDRSEVERLLTEAQEKLGGLHGIVDIVGMARYRPISHTSDEDWEWTFDMVLRHAFLFGQIGGGMLADAGGGAVTYIASVSGITGAPLHAAYGAAKAGLISLVKSSAVEFGPKAVRFNAVAPGFVWTPRVAAMLGDKGKQVNVDNSPLRRVATPTDVAATVLYLSSDLASYVTGQVVVVDGGVGQKFPYPMDF